MASMETELHELLERWRLRGEKDEDLNQLMTAWLASYAVQQSCPYREMAEIVLCLYDELRQALAVEAAENEGKRSTTH